MSSLPYRRSSTAPMRPQRLPRLPPLTLPHRLPSRAAKEIQTTYDQRTVKACHSVRPMIKKVMSRWWQVSERATATRVMPSCPKTHPRARPTRQTSRDTPAKLRKFTRSQRASSSKSHDQRYFFTALTRSSFQSLTMPRPTCQKTTKIMAPHQRSTPSHLCHTHHWKTPRWP